MAEIVDSNTLFPHLMMAMSSHFAYVDSNRQLLSNCCTCPNTNESLIRVKLSLFAHIK
jgi:hypothetical protein